MNGRGLFRLCLAGLVGAARVPYAAHAGAALAEHCQTDGSVGAAESGLECGGRDTQSLDTVVVTAAPLSVTKRDASYPVVVADAEQIKRLNPKSTADLMKISPGIWPESSGGQTGANIEVAGFPSGGDAPYFTVQMNGSPLYGMPSVLFFEHSSALRLDATVERVEIVQGGPSIVFADGQMGATANFILKRGTDKPAGSLAFTYGSERLERLDAFGGFKIAQGWYGSVGGFYRTSKGVPAPGFPADKGGQVTGTLSHNLEKGSIMLYARALHDKNQFITPLPLIQHGTDHFSAYPGFDPLTGTYASQALRHVLLPTYPGGGSNADLANGRGADMHFFGVNLDLQPADGWIISDRLLIDGGNMDTNALFSGSIPATLANEISPDPDPGGYQIPAGAVVSATYVGGGVVDPNQSVIHHGWWFVHKRLFNINNDLRVSRRLFAGNTLTGGLYFAHYRNDDHFSIGNELLMSNTPNAGPIVVNYFSDGLTYHRTDPQGFIDFSNNFNGTEHGTATNIAFYLSDSWRVSRWLFDAAARIETEHATNRVCDQSNIDLDDNPLNLYNKGVPTCTGSFTTTDYDPTRTSWSVGVNNELANNLSAFGRIERGIHFLSFGDLLFTTTGNTPPEQTIENLEVGLKYQGHWLYADVVAYRKRFSGLLYVPTNAQGVPLPGPPLVYGADSKGLNAIMVITPTARLGLQLTGNYLDGHYTHYAGCLPFSNVVTSNGCAVIEGRPLQRQPKVHLAFTPSYRLPMAWGELTAFVTYTYVGSHYQDQSGLQQLGTYTTLDFGVIAAVRANWEVRVQGTNLSNELGLTESTSTIFGVAPAAGGVILARTLEGREVNIELKYKF